MRKPVKTGSWPLRHEAECLEVERSQAFIALRIGLDPAHHALCIKKKLRKPTLIPVQSGAQGIRCHCLHLKLLSRRRPRLSVVRSGGSKDVQADAALFFAFVAVLAAIALKSGLASVPARNQRRRHRDCHWEAMSPCETPRRAGAERAIGDRMTRQSRLDARQSL